MRLMGLATAPTSLNLTMPAPVLSRFARIVYGHRFFQAIMSSMPGPVGTYRLAGAPIAEVYPIVPLAPRVALSSW